ncbi:MAG TPA: hypothetical protein PKM43_12750 [Verrucomicrobiota bacterium]|nr:hypothetical protein [Verrucomicrobiota bacterium]HRZ35810.1 hypothetical protein [Candidatus Paceibacterota bacterium]HRZ56107.1 hypothetical protein [Candidatus Paceibacterota bacterium]
MPGRKPEDPTLEAAFRYMLALNNPKSPAVKGPWYPIPGAANPHLSSDQPAQFFRVKVP